MTNQPTFLPTTKPQCALVYALNALLLFNLTVIVVMLSDTGLQPQPFAERSGDTGVIAGEPERRTMSLDRVSHEPSVTEDPLQVAEVMSEPVVLVSDQAAVYEDPEAVVDKPAADRTVAPVKQQVAEHPPVKQPQVKQQPSDPPTTFFGVGLE